MADESIALVVTSPPYWHIKNYGVPHQIGYGQTLHEYLYDLARVWRECWRVLMPGRRLCINIGDQFARAVIYGQYKVIPLHAEIIAQCETVGFDYLGAIIWQKKTTMRPSGGAVVMGSFPYPPNGIVELDYEYILLFRKPGKSSPVDEAVREASALTRDEWKTYFSGHWQFGGERQVQHEAMFPEELPRRLIRMFSFVGETVLDPFVGSG
ncbi:MAG: site-specific DNA-methyltransferase, partial [Acidobacteria bacterium]|nr:site-specific DNA-methyltransferase [Acidobacteriota bacterium]